MELAVAGGAVPSIRPRPAAPPPRTKYQKDARGPLPKWTRAALRERELKQRVVRLWQLGVRKGSQTAAGSSKWHWAFQRVQQEKMRLKRAMLDLGFSPYVMVRVVRWLHRARERAKEWKYIAFAVKWQEQIDEYTTVRSPLRDPDIRTEADLKMLAKEALQMRVRLREHKKVVACMDRWWRRATCVLVAKGDPTPSALSKQYYFWMMRKLYKHFVPFATEKEAAESLLTDWEFDRKGEDALSYESFLNAIFALADVWTEDLDPESYVSFLDNCYMTIFNVFDFDPDFDYVQPLVDVVAERRKSLQSLSPLSSPLSSSPRQARRRSYSPSSTAISPMQFHLPGGRRRSTGSPITSPSERTARSMSCTSGMSPRKGRRGSIGTPPAVTPRSTVSTSPATPWDRDVGGDLRLEKEGRPLLFSPTDEFDFDTPSTIPAAPPESCQDDAQVNSASDQEAAQSADDVKLPSAERTVSSNLRSRKLRKGRRNTTPSKLHTSAKTQQIVHRKSTPLPLHRKRSSQLQPVKTVPDPSLATGRTPEPLLLKQRRRSVGGAPSASPGGRRASLATHKAEGEMKGEGRRVTVLLEASEELLNHPGLLAAQGVEGKERAVLEGREHIIRSYISTECRRIARALLEGGEEEETMWDSSLHGHSIELIPFSGAARVVQDVAGWQTVESSVVYSSGVHAWCCEVLQAECGEMVLGIVPSGESVGEPETIAWGIKAATGQVFSRGRYLTGEEAGPLHSGDVVKFVLDCDQECLFIRVRGRPSFLVRITGVSHGPWRAFAAFGEGAEGDTVAIFNPSSVGTSEYGDGIGEKGAMRGVSPLEKVPSYFPSPRRKTLPARGVLPRTDSEVWCEAAERAKARFSVLELRFGGEGRHSAPRVSPAAHLGAALFTSRLAAPKYLCEATAAAVGGAICMVMLTGVQRETVQQHLAVSAVAAAVLVIEVQATAGSTVCECAAFAAAAVVALAAVDYVEDLTKAKVDSAAVSAAAACCAMLILSNEAARRWMVSTASVVGAAAALRTTAEAVLHDTILRREEENKRHRSLPPQPVKPPEVTVIPLSRSVKHHSAATPVPSPEPVPLPPEAESPVRAARGSHDDGNNSLAPRNAPPPVPLAPTHSSTMFPDLSLKNAVIAEHWKQLRVLKEAEASEWQQLMQVWDAGQQAIGRNELHRMWVRKKQWELRKYHGQHITPEHRPKAAPPHRRPFSAPPVPPPVPSSPPPPPTPPPPAPPCSYTWEEVEDGPPTALRVRGAGLDGERWAQHEPELTDELPSDWIITGMYEGNARRAAFPSSYHGTPTTDRYTGFSRQLGSMSPLPPLTSPSQCPITTVRYTLPPSTASPQSSPRRDETPVTSSRFPCSALQKSAITLHYLTIQRKGALKPVRAAREEKRKPRRMLRRLAEAIV